MIIWLEDVPKKPDGVDIYNVLMPMKLKLSGFCEPRLVSFERESDKGGDGGMSKKSKEMLLLNRVKKVRAAMKSFGQKCPASYLCRRTGFTINVISTSLQYMRKHGMVKSSPQRKGGAHDWELIE